MEQQINPNEPTNEATFKDQSNVVSRYIMPKVVRSLLLCMCLSLAVGGIGWYVNQKTASTSQDVQIEEKEDVVPEVTETQEAEVEENLPVAKKIENAKGMVAYNTLNIPVLKTRTVEFETGTVKNIGTVTDGVFKDKILAVGLRNETSPYAYFITDTMGNTLAWDQDFVFDEENYCYENCAVWKNFFGLAEDRQQNLDFLPSELSAESTLLARSNAGAEAQFSTDYSYVEEIDEFQIPVGVTESGFKITKPSDNSYTYFGQIPEYNLRFPFGISSGLRPEPDFMNSDDVPQLLWTKGTKDIASYRYGQYAYGWEDCYAGLTTEEITLGFSATGVTNKGDQVFEIDALKYPGVYKCLYEKTKRYVYNEETGDGEYVETVSYNDFVGTHPMFFWKHPFGDAIAFMRSDVVPAAEKAKPVIYLYPEKEEKINVKVAPVGGFTVTDPEYGDGWVVSATPEGVITNSVDEKQYPYLFWEGGKDGVVVTPKEGFVVAKADVPEVLENTLSQFGLNEQERADFKEFWVPKLSRAPYYFLTFISRSEIDRVAPMTISPKPDTVIRVLMDYKPLTEAVDVEPLTITPTLRTGFTVVEWGGIVRD